MLVGSDLKSAYIGVPQRKLRIMGMNFNVRVNTNEGRGLGEPGPQNKNENALSFCPREMGAGRSSWAENWMHRVPHFVAPLLCFRKYSYMFKHAVRYSKCIEPCTQYNLI